MNVKIGKKEYKLEYTFEAAHQKKCVDICWNYFSGAYMMKGAALGELESNETVSKVATIDKMIDSMSDIPQMVISLFYAGLLENHEDEVQEETDARKLYKQFCKENPEDERAGDFGMLEAIKKQMEEEGFFKRIGLDKFLKQMRQTEEKQAKKLPQDHRKKTADHSGN